MRVKPWLERLAPQSFGFPCELSSLKQCPKDTEKCKFIIATHLLCGDAVKQRCRDTGDSKPAIASPANTSRFGLHRLAIPRGILTCHRPGGQRRELPDRLRRLARVVVVDEGHHRQPPTQQPDCLRIGRHLIAPQSRTAMTD